MALVRSLNALRQTTYNDRLSHLVDCVTILGQYEGGIFGADWAGCATSGTRKGPVNNRPQDAILPHIPGEIMFNPWDAGH